MIKNVTKMTKLLQNEIKFTIRFKNNSKVVKLLKGEEKFFEIAGKLH